MTAAFGLLIRATLLMAAAWAAAAALRKAGAPAAARHMAWLLGIIALLALPAFCSLVPALRLPILPVEPATVAHAAAQPASGLVGSALPDTPELASWQAMLLVAYALGAVTLLLRVLIGRRLLARLWCDATASRDASWDILMTGLSAEIRLTRRVELRIARGPVMPMTWGTRAPKLLLPAEASGWPAEQQRLVLLHELAHVARRDSLSRSLASLACAIYWFHPGIWFAARQMRMEQELAADDRVLTAGGSPHAYARSLLHIAGGTGGRPPYLAAAMVGICQLEHRLVSITGPARHDRPGAAFLSSSALIATLATLVLAAAVPVSRSAPLLEPEQLRSVSPIERNVDFAEAEDRSASGPQPDRVFSTRVDPVTSKPRSSEQALKTGIAAQARPARRQENVSVQDELDRPGKEARTESRRAPAYVEQLPDYGWELRRPDAKAQLASVPPPTSRPARLPLPTSLSTASKERTGRPKWAKVVPQIVPAGTPTRSRPLGSQGALALAWSIDVGAR